MCDGTPLMSSRVLQTIITLADSDEYRFVHVENMGIVSSYSPRTTRGDHQVMIFVSHVVVVTFKQCDFDVVFVVYIFRG